MKRARARTLRAADLLVWLLAGSLLAACMPAGLSSPTAIPSPTPTQAPLPTAMPVTAAATASPTARPAVPPASVTPSPAVTARPSETRVTPASSATPTPSAGTPTSRPSGSLPDLRGRKVTAVTGNDLPPLNLVDPGSGKGAGWEYDAINETCRRLNCQVNWQTMAWDKMIAAVHDGKYDVGAEGISITEEARQQVAFSIPYMTAEHHLLVRAGENRFQSAPEFAADAKLRVGAQRGSGSFYAAVYGVLDGSEDSPRVKQYPTVRAAVQGLLAGEVDMVVLDGQASRGYLGANAGKLKALAEPLDSEDFGFIFKPGSDLVAPFNAALESMLKDGFTQQLDQKWFFQYDPPAS